MELTAKIREKTGKKAKALRRQGIVPAVLYGKGKESACLEIEHREFRCALKEAGESTVVKLKIVDENGKEKIKNVLIYSVEKDPLTDRFTHVDFYEVRMDEKRVASIPLVFTGEAPATKQGGTLVKNKQEIEVKALPKDLPRQIEIDISDLNTFEDRILVSSIKCIEGVEILTQKEEIIALVAPPRKEEEVAPLSGEAEATITEPEAAKEPQGGEGSKKEE